MFKEIMYCIAYAFTVPVLKIATITKPEIKNSGSVYMKFYSDGITYKNYRRHMIDFKIRDKMSSELLLYIPSLIVVMIILLTISLVG